jgi:hypothetical protein
MSAVLPFAIATATEASRWFRTANVLTLKCQLRCTFTAYKLHLNILGLSAASYVG